MKRNYKPCVIVTGGSGFIGTNLCTQLCNKGYQVYNVDIKRPINPKCPATFIHASILDADKMENIIHRLNPTYIIHLAARTDLSGTYIKDYEENTYGVFNVCRAAANLPVLKKAVFASSMLVNRMGVVPRSIDDYSPNTMYGCSKVITEKIIRSFEHEKFTIVRPTSLWGPWFGAPYSNFFNAVLSGSFLKICDYETHKTFGFIDNAIKQIEFVMKQDISVPLKCYLGDSEPLSINRWSGTIREHAGLKPNLAVRKITLKRLAKIGDAISIMYDSFPLSSFRYKNLTTDNIYTDYIIDTPGEFMVDNVVAVKKTLKWLKEK